MTIIQLRIRREPASGNRYPGPVDESNDRRFPARSSRRNGTLKFILLRPYSVMSECGTELGFINPEFNCCRRWPQSQGGARHTMVQKNVRFPLSLCCKCEPTSKYNVNICCVVVVDVGVAWKEGDVFLSSRFHAHQRTSGGKSKVFCFFKAVKQARTWCGMFYERNL